MFWWGVAQAAELGVDPMVAGRPSTLRLTGLSPGASAVIFGSDQGLASVPRCSPTYPAACNELADPRPFGFVVADALGEASFSGVVPFAADHVWLQALSWDGIDGLATPVVAVDVADPAVAPGVRVSIDERAGLRDLVARVETFDPQGDPVSLTWSWTVDGAPTAYAGDRVPATDLSPGETWEVTVAPSDGATLGAPARASVVVPTPPATNVLVILLDDVSTNKLALYDPAVPAVSLPTIDALAAQGVTFDQAYASPMCSPTRAALLTGRHARRTGFATVANDAGDQLSYKEVTVAEALDDNVLGLDWSTAALGKWHLAQKSVERLHPNKSGFDHFSGVFTVMSETVAPLNDYYDWEETTDGVIVGRSTVYHTTDIVDDALAHIPTMPEPWFLYLPMTAPHDPLHVPPSALVTDPVDAYSADAELYDAMLQAADAEIGRLLAGIDPAVLANTTVLLTADNGSQPEVVEAPYDPDRSKRSVYQGGIHVPLVITGPLVTQPGARTDALVHLVDVFTTALDIAGVPLVDVDEAHRVLGYTSPSGAVHPVDGSSLLPYLADPASPSLRPWLFAEHMEPNGPPPYANDLVAWQDHEWKLVRNNGVAELYQFVAGAVDEGPDLLADGVTADEQAKLDELTQLLDDQLAAMPYDGDW